MTSTAATQKILFLFDPLCGWCYAVSKGMEKLAQTEDVEMIPTGLFSRDKTMSPEWAQHAWENDERIAGLTGAPFSEAYRQNILMQPTNFNSFALVQALAAVLREIGCTRAAEILQDSAIEAQAKQRIAGGSETARRFGVGGVPFVVKETAQGWERISSESLW